MIICGTNSIPFDSKQVYPSSWYHIIIEYMSNKTERNIHHLLLCLPLSATLGRLLILLVGSTGRLLLLLLGLLGHLLLHQWGVRLFVRRFLSGAFLVPLRIRLCVRFSTVHQ